MAKNNWVTTFNHVCSSFPGFRIRGLGSKTRCSIKNDAATAKMVVSVDDDGQMASLVVDYAATRCDISTMYTYGKRSNVITFECSTRKMIAFIRYLEYASTEILAPGLNRVELPENPLPKLLSHVLQMFKDDYDRNGERTKLPALPAWANILQFISREPTSGQSFRKRINISRRVLKIALDALSQLDWIAMDRDGSVRGGQIVSLTEEGESLNDSAADTIENVETAWVDKFGEKTIDDLRSGLIAVAEKIELELPHYLVGYGVADQSITGGSPCGNEWPNVERDANMDVSELPLPTLLSKVLAAFTIEYESHGLGGLAWASQCLIYMSDKAMSLGDVRQYGIAGNGKSAPERHLSVVITDGRPGDDSRKVYLTPKSRRTRDSYAALLNQVEGDWRDVYGAESMECLKKALIKIGEHAPEDIPDYPDTALWLKYPLKSVQQPVYAFKPNPSPREKWGDVATTCYAGRRAAQSQ